MQASSILLFSVLGGFSVLQSQMINERKDNITSTPFEVNAASELWLLLEFEQQRENPGS